VGESVEVAERLLGPQRRLEKKRFYRRREETSKRGSLMGAGWGFSEVTDGTAEEDSVKKGRFLLVGGGIAIRGECGHCKKGLNRRGAEMARKKGAGKMNNSAWKLGIKLRRWLDGAAEVEKVKISKTERG